MGINKKEALRILEKIWENQYIKYQIITSFPSIRRWHCGRPMNTVRVFNGERNTTKIYYCLCCTAYYYDCWPRGDVQFLKNAALEWKLREEFPEKWKEYQSYLNNFIIQGIYLVDPVTFIEFCGGDTRPKIKKDIVKFFADFGMGDIINDLAKMEGGYEEKKPLLN